MKTSIKLLIIVLLIFKMSELMAQDSLLTGYWQLEKISQNSVVVFDRNNIDATIDGYKKVQRPMDSVAVRKFREVTHPLMKKMYYEFLVNGELNAGVLGFVGDRSTLNAKKGIYQIDGEKIGLILSGHTETYTYKIISDTLILRPIINRKTYGDDYARYVKQVNVMIQSDPPPFQQEKPKDFVEAHYPGGMDSASIWVQENLKNYPDILDYFNADNTKLIFLSIRIVEDGKPEYSRSTQELPEEIDEQFRQIISQMPKWHPATSNGTSVRSKVLVKVGLSNE